MKSSNMAGAVCWWGLVFPAFNGWLLTKVYTYNPQIKHWRIKQTGCGFHIVRNRTGFTVCVCMCACECECATYWMYSAHQPRLHLWNAYRQTRLFTHVRSHHTHSACIKQILSNVCVSAETSMIIQTVIYQLNCELTHTKLVTSEALQPKWCPVYQSGDFLRSHQAMTLTDDTY